MARLLYACKATLVLNLVILAVAAALSALVWGFRLPVGEFGVSMISDPQGQPYVVIDHSSTQGWLLGYDSAHHRVEAWTGTVVIQ